MYQYKTWYAASKMMESIRLLGSTIYEREILLEIFCRYTKIYSRDTRNHQVQISLRYLDLSSSMGRKKYFDSIASLKKNGVIDYSSTKGRTGHQQVSIITLKTVDCIKSKRFSTESLISTDRITWF